MGEGRREGVSGDFLVVDVDALEEGLVEEPAFGWVGLEVGGLHVVGEVERVVERFEDCVLVDLVALEEFLGGDALASDPLLFLGEDVVADRVVVVGAKEFSLLVVEPDDFGARPGGFLLGDLR